MSDEPTERGLDRGTDAAAGRIEGSIPDDEAPLTPDTTSAERPETTGGEKSTNGDRREARHTKRNSSTEKARDIATVEEFFRDAYSQAGKRLTLPRAVFARIDRPELFLEPSEPAFGAVAELSLDDPFLAVPPRILMAVDEANPAPGLRRHLVGCVASVLRQHPVFRGEMLQAALNAEVGSRDDLFDATRAAVARVTPGVLGLDSDQITRHDRKKLLVNATTSLALLLALRDGWSTDDFVECLYRHQWTQLPGRRTQRPRALVADSRTPDVLGTVARTFDRRAKREAENAANAELRADDAMRRALEAQAAVAAREQGLAESGVEIEHLRSRIAELESAIESEQHRRTVDQSHHVDDYEALRTRVMRLLDKQSRLMSDGLHALRNDRPMIADEFLERAIDAFGIELDQLKDRKDLP